MNITPIPALADNYIWLLQHEKRCVIVDPGEAEPVLKYLDAQGMEPVAILLTHHHWDHVNGAVALQERFEIPMHGPSDARVPGKSNALAEGDTVTIKELDLRLEILDIPGHTRSHIAFYNNELLLSGDTLFSVGCGKTFEGTAEQMLNSLDKLAALPDSLQVYCGHEYTVSNCEFALMVEPGNEELQKRHAQAKSLRANGEPTVPSTLAQEQATNPFLRCREPEVAQAARNHANRDDLSASEVFGTLRSWKDES